MGVLGWLKKNLFSTWYDALLTIGSLAFIYWALRGVIEWAIIKATFSNDPGACKKARVAAVAAGETAGACWSVVITNIKVFMIGRYPSEEAWRIWASLGIVAVLAVLTWLIWKSEATGARRWVIIGWLSSFPVIMILLRGFSEESRAFPLVPTDLWSGLLLTFVLAIVGIVSSFPLGVLLALGRRSDLPALKVFCTMYIELIRGVPLISVLFMSQLLLPIFLPPEVRLGTVLRALVGMTLFSAAYSAENVRGGLAAIPIGQYEAAKAVGLNDVLMMALIILPQAIQKVIPAIVGQFISLFKDTTLVVIIGLLDLLGVAKAVTGQKDFIGLQKEVYLFAALIYFICSYAMSYSSRRLEVAMGVGER
ncbi:MAG TPA: amino acid ABC transporter permease [Anaerolineae bacterium]|nr:amino acid ABC transporter permease [Anaerolineae bacterium]